MFTRWLGLTNTNSAGWGWHCKWKLHYIGYKFAWWYWITLFKYIQSLFVFKLYNVSFFRSNKLISWSSKSSTWLQALRQRIVWTLEDGSRWLGERVETWYRSLRIRRYKITFKHRINKILLQKFLGIVPLKPDRKRVRSKPNSLW